MNFAGTAQIAKTLRQAAPLTPKFEPGWGSRLTVADGKQDAQRPRCHQSSARLLDERSLRCECVCVEQRTWQLPESPC